MKDGTSLCLHTYLLLVSSHGSVWGGGGQGRCVTCICTLALTEGWVLVGVSVGPIFIVQLVKVTFKVLKTGRIYLSQDELF